MASPKGDVPWQLVALDAEAGTVRWTARPLQGFFNVTLSASKFYWVNDPWPTAPVDVHDARLGRSRDG